MDAKMSSELLESIRSAVILKLREMDRFVDNELPDYIMILVANKRTIAHMQKDLSLFLGKHTMEFTHWLFDMVAHLKKSGSKTKVPLKSLKTDKSLEKSNSDEDADVLNYDLGDQETDLFHQDDSNLSLPEATKPKGEISSSIFKNHEETSSVLSERQATQKSVKVLPVQPIFRSSSKVANSPIDQHSLTDEYDPTKPEFTGSISSIAQFPRKTFHRPPSFQTNKLLMRAVNDATKSVMDSRNVNKYKPTPIKMLSTSKKESKEENILRHSLDNVDIASNLEFEENESLNYSEELSHVTNRDEVVFEIDDNFFGASKSNRTICLSKEDDMSVTEPVSVKEDPYSSVVKDVTTVQEVEENAPHFIVTLDGAKFSSIKRKLSGSEESMEVDDDFSADEGFEASPNQKRQKVVERCKYWPSCKNSDNCVYHHPSIPCKTFPDCKYGDKCHYIHPNCKFDSRCSRKGCPYTHAIKKKFIPPPVPKQPARIRGFKTVCKFYPKCTVKNCAFVHPKLCRFGTKCRLSTCQFTHVSIPSRNQMKWKANASGDTL